MAVYWFDPTLDPRWPEFIDRHPESSVFHTAGWLEALKRTYDFQPLAATTSPPGSPLANGIVFCRVDSWLTGRRLVSLPFSDHCQPLLDSEASSTELMEGIHQFIVKENLKFFELRPWTGAPLSPPGHPALTPSASYCMHMLDLHPPLETIYSGFHKDCVQRKIRRAEKEGLVECVGRHEWHLRVFFKLQVMTRRRQGVPVQPFAWFWNLAECLGDRLTIRVAAKESRGIAALLILRHKETVIYKYGTSNERYSPLGGTQFLFRNVIRDAKASGAGVLDMGRSDLDAAGLIAFKERFGALRSELSYYRGSTRPAARKSGRLNKLMHNPVTRFPFKMLPTCASALYRHFA